MIRFEWDPAKARSNERKHGVSFEIALHVFEDPNALVEQDRIEAVNKDGKPLGLWEECWCCWWHTRCGSKMRRESTKSSASSLPGGRIARRNNAMRKKVKRVAAGNPLTPRQRRDIAAIAGKPDSEIDYSDIPRLPESFWKAAVRNPFYRPVKRQVTIRLDADVIAWLRTQGKGYQSRLNRLLRDAMLEDFANGKAVSK